MFIHEIPLIGKLFVKLRKFYWQSWKILQSSYRNTPFFIWRGQASLVPPASMLQSDPGQFFICKYRGYLQYIHKIIFCVFTKSLFPVLCKFTCLNNNDYQHIFH